MTMDTALFHPVFKPEITAPTSKSSLIRLLICALLSGRKTDISFDGCVSDDIAAVLDCMRALGVRVSVGEKALTVAPPEAIPASALLDCRSSGTALRFFTALSAGFGIKARLCFSEELARRPMTELLCALTENGALFENGDRFIDVKQGTIASDFSIAGDISSQFISGLLFACAKNGGRIRLTSPLQSTGYVRMTISALSAFGCTIEQTADGFTVPEAFPLSAAGNLTAEGDWSNAAFALIGGVIGKAPVTVKGLSLTSLQADKSIIDILTAMGADIRETDGDLTAFPSVLHGVSVSGRDIPHLILPLSIAMAQANGDSTITEIRRLRYKETDRIRSLVELINALGGKAAYKNDVLYISGTPLTGGKVNGYADHRTVMAAALAATVCRNEVTVSDAQAVNKSYPAFFSQFI